MNPRIYPAADIDCWLEPDFLPASDQEAQLARLSQEINWHQDKIRLFGREQLIPRLQAFMGAPGIHYRYSGLTLEASGWHPVVEHYRQRLLQATGTEFNAVLLNLYRDGQDSMGWHRDNEPELGKDPVIASLSLGASRRFLLRHQGDQRRLELTLTGGSLLWMGRGIQQQWQHSIPKTRRCNMPRINLTFRQVVNS
ncbi:alpha-ketoglutarate-dependent dioxygenase AlkB family protein [Neptuniibacter halophilus]|uniref:alpha-ketoglutarate-dependent dioxygenase AlkB family protein n=1 Tax=Neptuniibacter halophilus TaxID=651666 RepID=UPI002574729E|nr:alpha-ketoglutarate-dependent dioxygenase AlkB [Neptuniibacter halophilus]